jgi:hypothetical protein
VSELGQVLALVREYGLALVVIVAVGIGFATGFIRFGRETKREREIADSKDAVITILTGEIKDGTAAMNRIADGLEARNQIEREMRGRRT